MKAMVISNLDSNTKNFIMILSVTRSYFIDEDNSIDMISIFLVIPDVFLCS